MAIAMHCNLKAARCRASRPGL